MDFKPGLTPECLNSSDFEKDDITTSQYWLFVILGILTLLVNILCWSNAILLFKNGRFKNRALLFFYLFSVITLIGKANYYIYGYSSVRFLPRHLYIME